MGRNPNQTKGGRAVKTGGKKLKKPKQPDSMPKRPQSSYFIFSNERRNQLKEQYPDRKVTELSRLIADEWKVKSAEEKKMYEDKAKEYKEKYTKEIEAYKETDEYAGYQKQLERWKQDQKDLDNMDEDEEPMKISLPRKPKDDQCPKKPLSSYFFVTLNQCASRPRRSSPM
eukprot:TRINITY_DN2933_c0_g1_i1.p1 TRINITY_DN2933_c0_g1~~TRINITY_DN2933_c0_g1_i1.p1  ORF type:complete len:191 (+),score=48.22 TRINITY_DN2933_c0_g1_i1:63-575(+)